MAHGRCGGEASPALHENNGRVQHIDIFRVVLGSDEECLTKVPKYFSKLQSRISQTNSVSSQCSTGLHRVVQNRMRGYAEIMRL